MVKTISVWVRDYDRRCEMKQKGFTLFEILLVIAIIAMMASLEF